MSDDYEVLEWIAAPTEVATANFGSIRDLIADAPDIAELWLVGKRVTDSEGETTEKLAALFVAANESTATDDRLFELIEQLSPVASAVGADISAWGFVPRSVRDEFAETGVRIC